MGGACSTDGEEEESIQDIGGKARRKDTTGKPKTCGRWTILKWILER
jgi:hypothetical protein